MVELIKNETRENKDVFLENVGKSLSSLKETVHAATVIPWETSGYNKEKAGNFERSIVDFKVYYGGSKTPLTGADGTLADGKHFEVFNDPYTTYAKDGKHVRDGFSEIKSADAMSFFVLGDGYAKDEKQVYCGPVVLSGAVPKTFEVMGNGYATDHVSNCYYHGSLILGAKVDSFQALSNGYAKDINNIYRNGDFLMNLKDVPESTVSLMDRLSTHSQ